MNGLELRILPLALLIFIGLYTAPARACGWDGCIFSHPDQFVSNAAQTVIETAKTNIEQSTEIAQTMSQGDVNGAMSHVGKLVIEGDCIFCKQAIENIAGTAAVATVEQMVSTGFFVMVNVSGYPMFVTYDAVDKKSLVTYVKPHEVSLISNTSPTGSHKRSSSKYSAVENAVCITGNFAYAVAGFSDIPQVKDIKTGATSSIVDSGLSNGDLITISAPVCLTEESKKNKQKSYTNINLIFRYDILAPRSGQSIKYYIYGKITKN